MFEYYMMILSRFLISYVSHYDNFVKYFPPSSYMPYINSSRTPFLFLIFVLKSSVFAELPIFKYCKCNVLVRNEL